MMRVKSLLIIHLKGSGMDGVRAVIQWGCYPKKVKPMGTYIILGVADIDELEKRMGLLA